jgi:KaiC/GvpD/RAD55 family RecA-like ATPase
MSEQHDTIASGIPPLDARVGGAARGRLHLMSGGPGTGKSTAGFQFIREGLRQGETVAMLTSDRVGDVRSHAAYLGMGLETPLRTGRLVLLRYRPGFSALLQHAAVPEQMLDDLRLILAPARPARVVVDTVLPVLASSPRSDMTLGALADVLEESGATILMTYSGDLTAARGAGYDYRIEPLVERAASVFHLTRQLGGHGASHNRGAPHEPSYLFHVVRVRQAIRSVAPAPYAIMAGVGLAEVVRPDHANAGAAERSTRVLALATAKAPSDEIVAVPGRDFAVVPQEVPAGAPVPDPAAEGAAVILVELRRETLGRDLALIHDLCTHPHAVPVIGATSERLRSADRARALRAGAVEVFACDTGPAELLERLHAIVRRGLSPDSHGARPTPRRADTLLTQPTEARDGTSVTVCRPERSEGPASAGQRYHPLDREGFAHALATHVANDEPTQYTVVSLVPARAPADRPTRESTLRALADAAIGSMRVGSGDLAAIMDDRVCVYLHGARLRDASPFVARIRERWSAAGRQAPRIESFGYPSDEPQLRVLMQKPGTARRSDGTSSRAGEPR